MNDDRCCFRNAIVHAIRLPIWTASLHGAGCTRNRDRLLLLSLRRHCNRTWIYSSRCNEIYGSSQCNGSHSYSRPLFRTQLSTQLNLFRSVKRKCVIAISQLFIPPADDNFVAKTLRKHRKTKHIYAQLNMCIYLRLCMYVCNHTETYADSSRRKHPPQNQPAEFTSNGAALPRAPSFGDSVGRG